MRKFSKNEIEIILKQLDFSKIEGDLIPVIAQDHISKEILMLAFANKEAIEKTLETGYMHYYSRTRQKIWKKGGETSGHFQEIEELITDCDNDSLLAIIKQTGAACHEGYYSCFYKTLSNGSFKENQLKVFDPKKIYST
jgi:phosphoribosyl-AMP cyclohydrolase